jgi:hypothetical protein
MATFRANVIYLVSLNKNFKTSVNVLRQANANVISGTGYAPQDIESFDGSIHSGLMTTGLGMHQPVTKTIEAPDLATAIAVFKATYGTNSLTDTPEQL